MISAKGIVTRMGQDLQGLGGEAIEPGSCAAGIRPCIQGQSAVVRVNDSPGRGYVRRSVGLLPAHYAEIQSIAAMEERSAESVMRTLLVLGLIQRRSEGAE